MLLVGDIGGTKTDLGVISPEAGPRAPLAQAEFKSGIYPDLEAIVREFLSQITLPIDWACFAVAGPVIGGRAKITNLPWVVEEDRLARELRMRSVHLLNDLEAIAWAVPGLGPSDLHTLNEGNPVTGGAIAVVAPGTGLGEAFLTWDGGRYRAHASEGGHADFAPTDPTQIRLLECLLKRYEHVSVELVCSGTGLPHIYECLRDTGYAPEPPQLAQRLAIEPDPTPVILDGAFHADPPCDLCVATLETFVSILGAEAGNLALKVLATGGVYLAGGMPLHILPALDSGRFMEAFRRKGRMADLLAQMPVHVLQHRAALIGAASYALEMDL